MKYFLVLSLIFSNVWAQNDESYKLEKNKIIKCGVSSPSKCQTLVFSSEEKMYTALMAGSFEASKDSKADIGAHALLIKSLVREVYQGKVKKLSQGEGKDFGLVSLLDYFTPSKLKKNISENDLVAECKIVEVSPGQYQLNFEEGKKILGTFSDTGIFNLKGSFNVSLPVHRYIEGHYETIGSDDKQKKPVQKYIPGHHETMDFKVREKNFKSSSDISNLNGKSIAEVLMSGVCNNYYPQVSFSPESNAHSYRIFKKHYNEKKVVNKLKVENSNRRVVEKTGRKSKRKDQKIDAIVQ